MEIYDFDKYDRPLSNEARDYGGQSGNKKSILIEKTFWFLKYPQNLKTKDMKNVTLSYSNAPLSEFIGSQVYEILGFNVHKTKLGISSKRRKVVVACKDFLENGDSFVPYSNIKNLQVMMMI